LRSLCVLRALPLDRFVGGDGAPVTRGAASPYFKNGTWEWRRCNVLAYLPGPALFDVQFVVSGRRKRVRRLNLMFDDEDSNRFKQRLARASAGREK